MDRQRLWNMHRSLMPRFSMFQRQQPQPQADDSQPAKATWSPSYENVREARVILKSLSLPTELVLDILDRARYWPRREFTMNGGRVQATAHPGAKICLEASVCDDDFVTHLFGEDEKKKIKEIEFEIVSKDQGWTSERTQGTYQTSSWLELSILRPRPADPHVTRIELANLGSDDFANPSDLQRKLQDHGWTLVTRPASAERGPQGGEGDLAWYLQGNKVASSSSAPTTVVWAVNRWDGNDGTGTGEGFLEELKEGDRVVVWARAKYPGWQCNVDSLKMTVRYDF